MVIPNKSVFNIITWSEFDDKYSVSILGKKVDKEYHKEWVKDNDVKLLTLDGTLGGSDGSAFNYFATDDVHDDWHIGKKYDMQGWFRFPMMLVVSNGKLNISYGSNNGAHNSYLIVSKRKLRENFKALKREKTDVLYNLAYQMVKKYLEGFNLIGEGMVYEIEFSKKTDDGIIVNRISDISLNIIEHSYKYVMNNIVSNLPSVDKEFDLILNGIFTQLSNDYRWREAIEKKIQSNLDNIFCN